MIQIAEFGTPTPSRGRQIRVTPERIQQIRNLVERGKRREEIAELVGVTVGSLQVTCSRLGISLRRANFNNGIVSLRRNDPRLKRVAAPGSDERIIAPGTKFAAWGNGASPSPCAKAGGGAKGE